MPDLPRTGLLDVLIIGAGVAGLTAARALADAGARVALVDKGRSVGGRLATRRIGEAVLDHGAQFLTARDPRFLALIDRLHADGVVEPWSTGFGGGGGGHQRWKGVPSMNGVARALARNLDVHAATDVMEIREQPCGWLAATQDGRQVAARALVLTAPVPQALALLDRGAVTLSPPDRLRLDAITYEPCLAVLVVLGAHSRIPAPGGLKPSDGPIGWIADNQQKGISPVPAATIHATAAFSARAWARDRDDVARELLAAAAPMLGVATRDYQIHGWRYARPIGRSPSACLVATGTAPLVFAGDAFGGSRVEGAALSGWAAAEALAPLVAR
jgi:renalase